MTSIQTRHKQVVAKVNAFVDKGIKDLVELLNTFNKVWTFDSCEGSEQETAYVLLYYGSPLEDNFYAMAQFADKLASAIGQIESGLDELPISDEVSISLEWHGDKKHPFVSIRIPSDRVDETISIFSAVSQQFVSDTYDKQP